jgi:hypothetical protein
VAWVWARLSIVKPKKSATARQGVAYLFLGKSGAILLGFPDTTQDADLFVKRDDDNGRRLIKGLLELGFRLTESKIAEIERGKDFIQLKNGPFDLDLIYAPDGIDASKTRETGA